MISESPFEDILPSLCPSAVSRLELGLSTNQLKFNHLPSQIPVSLGAGYRTFHSADLGVSSTCPVRKQFSFR
jgi:hypothetical protein